MALFITHLPPGRNSSHCFQQLAPHHTCSFCSWTTPEPENGQWVIAQVRVDHWQKDHPPKWEESTIKTWTDWTIIFFLLINVFPAFRRNITNQGLVKICVMEQVQSTTTPPPFPSPPYILFSYITEHYPVPSIFSSVIHSPTYPAIYSCVLGHVE